jgi:hypothetical protein
LNFFKNGKHFQIFKQAAASSRSCGRSAMSSSVLLMRHRRGALGEIPANSKKGSLEMCELKITHGGFGLEFWPVSKLEFHSHPNSKIRACKFQMGNSKPQFIHPNMHLGFLVQQLDYLVKTRIIHICCYFTYHILCHIRVFNLKSDTLIHQILVNLNRIWFL